MFACRLWFHNAARHFVHLGRQLLWQSESYFGNSPLLFMLVTLKLDEKADKLTGSLEKDRLCCKRTAV